MAIVSLLPNSRNLPQQLTISDQPAYRGGEGSVFFTLDGQYVVKVYHAASSDKQKLLQQILDLGKNLGEDEQFLAWPLGIVDKLNGQPKVGVVTRRVASSFVPLYKMIYSPADAMTQFQKGRSWLEYVKTARATAAAVRTIHGKGLAHGDIHLKNVLVNPVSGEAVLIDLDGLIVKGFLPPQVKGMPGFIAPEVMMRKAKPDEATDRYSLAVLTLWTLLLRNTMLPRQCYDEDDFERDEELAYGQEACFSEHPRDRRNWIPRIGTPLFRNGAISYRSLSLKLQELTEQALIQGLQDIHKRPQSIEWERALAEAYDLLVVCSTCRQSYFYQYWLQPPPRRQCPFCGTGARPPFPAILELVEARARGTYVPARTLAFYHGLPLFADITEPGALPPFTRRGIPILGQCVWDASEGVHRLFNGSDTPWQMISGSIGFVSKGAGIALRKGLLFSFGDGKRLARVIE